MPLRLAGKTAFLTAAAHGIGRATALAFAREGARVIATDVDQAGLDALARECGASVRVLDVTDAAAIAATAREVGNIPILFNAAGYVHAGSVLDFTDAEWDLAFNLNARSMAHTIRAFLPGMLAEGGGAIVNIASIAGSVKGRAQPLRLCREQGRGYRPDQGGGGRFRHPRHPLQRDLSRHGRLTVAEAAHHRASPSQRQDRGGGQGNVRRAPADGQARYG